MQHDFIDELEGFDGNETVYNEKEDKKYHSGIWRCLLFVGTLLLLYAGYHHIMEIKLLSIADYIEVPCTQAGIVTYEMDGQTIKFQIPDIYLSRNQENIRLYYTKDIHDAVPIYPAIVWVEAYGLSLLLIGLSLWRLIVIYRRK